MQENQNLTYGVGTYNIPEGYVGRAVIFSNDAFEGNEAMGREGNNQDETALESVLRHLGFAVIIHRNLTKSDADNKIQELSHDDFKEDSCFLAIFLSHGDEDKVQMSCGRVLHIKDDIIDSFRGNKCSTLNGKPKIFIFETCRGRRTEETTRLAVSNIRSLRSNASAIFTEMVGWIFSPAGSDFLVCYAADSGRQSYTNSTYGSWFTQTFVAILWHYMHTPDPSMDFVSLMTVVTENVCRKRWTDETGRSVMQVPCVVSTFRKKLQFPKLCKKEKILRFEDKETKD